MIILDMDMPGCCRGCVLCNSYMNEKWCSATEDLNDISNDLKRPDWCPIVGEITEKHGRLIDADMLMEFCQNNVDKSVDCNDIARFPTVLEATEDKL